MPTDPWNPRPGSNSGEPVFPGPGPHAYYKPKTTDNKKKVQQYRGEPVFPGPGPHAYYRKPPAPKGAAVPGTPYYRKPGNSKTPSNPHGLSSGPNPNEAKQRLAQTDALKRVAQKYTKKGPK